MSKEQWLSEKKQEGASILDEVLQKVEDPIAELRKQGDKVAVIVPYEYLWPPELKPFGNPEHKRNYDADLLAQHLEEAGYRSHVIRIVQNAGWSWLTADAVKVLNSKERRRLRRHGTMPMRDTQAVAGVGGGSDGRPQRDGKAGGTEDGDEGTTWPPT